MYFTDGDWYVTIDYDIFKIVKSDSKTTILLVDKDLTKKTCSTKRLDYILAGGVGIKHQYSFSGGTDIENYNKVLNKLSLRR